MIKHILRNQNNKVKNHCPGSGIKGDQIPLISILDKLCAPGTIFVFVHAATPCPSLLYLRAYSLFKALPDPRMG